MRSGLTQEDAGSEHPQGRHDFRPQRKDCATGHGFCPSWSSGPSTSSSLVPSSDEMRHRISGYNPTQRRPGCVFCKASSSSNSDLPSIGSCATLMVDFRQCVEINRPHPHSVTPIRERGTAIAGCCLRQRFGGQTGSQTTHTRAYRYSPIEGVAGEERRDDPTGNRAADRLTRGYSHT
jgi:hypothetical protein